MQTASPESEMSVTGDERTVTTTKAVLHRDLPSDIPKSHQDHQLKLHVTPSPRPDHRRIAPSSEHLSRLAGARKVPSLPWNHCAFFSPRRAASNKSRP
ncbi:hypothetical protein YC2023_029547 [Brassica napus]